MEGQGTVPVFSGPEKMQAWAMVCVRLAWVLGGLVIPAGDRRAGGPLGSGWCFLLIGQTPFLTRTSPRESFPLTWTLYFPKSHFPSLLFSVFPYNLYLNYPS